MKSSWLCCRVPPAGSGADQSEMSGMIAVAAVPWWGWQLAPGKAPSHIALGIMTLEYTAPRARSSKLLSKEA